MQKKCWFHVIVFNNNSRDVEKQKYVEPLEKQKQTAHIWKQILVMITDCFCHLNFATEFGYYRRMSYSHSWDIFFVFFILCVIFLPVTKLFGRDKNVAYLLVFTYMFNHIPFAHLFFHYKTLVWLICTLSLSLYDCNLLKIQY